VKTDTEIVDSCEHVAVDAVLSFFTETYPVLRCSKCNAFLGYKLEVVDEPV